MIIVKGNVSLILDDYEDGEVATWQDYYWEDVYKDKFDNFSDFLDYIDIRFDLKESDLYYDNNKLYISVLVSDEYFKKPTEKEIERWKNGDKKLYSGNFILTLYESLTSETYKKYGLKEL